MNLEATQVRSGSEKLLVRGVNWLGDAVMSTPALQRLREAKPDADITLLTPEKLAGLWRHHPSVDRVMAFAENESAWKIGARLRGENFQTAVVFPNSIRSALEVWLARVPRRVGYACPWRSIFLTQPLPSRAGAVKMRKRTTSEIAALIQRGGSAAPYPASAHHIHDYLKLVSALGANAAPVAPKLVVTDDELKRATQKFGIAPGVAAPLCGLNPGAEYGPAKRWPVERFVAAAKEIQQRTNCRWIIFGGPGDAGLAAEIVANISQPLRSGEAQQRIKNGAVINVAGLTDLRELCALLKACDVLLTNDTGPMHVAAALGTPAVVPFGSTSPELTGPGLPGDPQHLLLKSGVPCAPCFRRECPIDFRCMHGISVEAVVESVLRAMRH